MKFIIAFLLAASISVPLANAEVKKCRALVMEGGGTRNAYTVGVLKAIINLLPTAERAYDVVSGVSMGAINAFIMGMHGLGDEKAAVNEMLEFWERLSAEKVYENWDFGIVEGFFKRSGLYNHQPFAATLQDLRSKYNRSFRRNFSISLVDLNSGTPLLNQRLCRSCCCESECC
eukprot:TRINITY_DN2946_c0_g1_i6.p1 TRINITY_DN2946_c0_g1~~TRINITY_DN2946_c0_g1_i6.p1  ORF type:complete len:174 (-),score=34.27 TRINITY_DN2946_c0_g1_i6:667-1188(-)